MARRGGTQVDGFGTFLETINSQESKQQPTGDPALQILTTVATGSQPVPKLLASSGLSFTDFSRALITVREAGFVTVDGPPGHEEVALTPLGVQMAHSQVR